MNKQQEEALREHLRLYRQLKASHHSHYMCGSARQEEEARYALDKHRLTIIDFLVKAMRARITDADRAVAQDGRS